MPDSNEKLDQLQTRLENLEKYEAGFKREIASIRYEIQLLKNREQYRSTRPEIERQNYSTPKIFEETHKPEISFPAAEARSDSKLISEPVIKEQTETAEHTNDSEIHSNTQGIEQYIGKYLISIIGILVTVLGVGIGAKYAIDNNWITPMMRIVFGYAIGLALVGFSVHLKEKYHTFSAVLLSGGMAIMYFISYFAYGYYEILSQTSAFALMVIFTVFTVLSALIYDRQIIALIGLVGGYAVPFLLSDGSGRVVILFSYIAMINIGILAVSLKKYWKYLFYLAFLLTWLIFRGWLTGPYLHSEHFGLASFFLGVFFALFYATFVGYKIFHDDPVRHEMMALIVLNSIVFFGFGYVILNTDGWNQFLGIFALSNAFIHYSVAGLLNKHSRIDRSTFYLLVVLVLTFLTIAVPVQANGNWITLFWLAEGTFLFIIGRTKQIRIFEFISGVVVALGLMSLAGGWLVAMEDNFRGTPEAITPLINGNFATSIFAVISLAVIFIVLNDDRYESQTDEATTNSLWYVIAASLLIVLYNTFRIEIGNYFYAQALQTAVNIAPRSVEDYAYLSSDDSLYSFNIIWQLIYTLFFLSALSFVNITRIKNSILGYANIALNLLTVFSFLTLGLFVLGDLRENYLSQISSELFARGPGHIAIRYVAIAFFLLILFATYKYIKQEFIAGIVSKVHLLTIFDLLVCFSFFVLLSSELIQWTRIFRINESFKIGLSLLWGGYALTLILVGIVKRKKHVRLFAIGLFALTLLKLFTYDIAELDTIRKTVVFVVTGILLLVASYLYNRFTKLIFGEEKI